MGKEVMSLLCDRDLLRAMDTGDLQVTVDGERVERSAFQAASIELHLGSEYARPRSQRWENAIVDADEPPDHLFVRHLLHNHGINGLLMKPQEFLLVCTAERVTLSRNLAARVDGKSTLGRLGLDVHSTAGFIDPGFSGEVTLELYNKAPYSIRLRQGMPIAQLVCERLTCPAERPYGTAGLGSRYQNSDGVVAPRRATMISLSEVVLPNPTLPWRGH
jgi:dCTP deaminase